MEFEKLHKKYIKSDYDTSKEELYPEPGEEIQSYCEGKPCSFHHAERADSGPNDDFKEDVAYNPDSHK